MTLTNLPQLHVLSHFFKKPTLVISALGAVGYRTTLFGVPSTVQAGYKALTVNVDKPIVAADVTLHGPFIGLTGYW